MGMMMRDASIDGRLQVTAAVSLLECSRLVQWVPDIVKFVPVAREDFEGSWRKDVHPVFGRLICWITFSAGTELLVKGVCLARGIEIRHSQYVPIHPHEDLQTWVQEFLKDWKSPGTVQVTHFGTLGNLAYDNQKTKTPAALKQLCSVVGATHDQEQRLLAAYRFLTKCIRNRDAHAYVPNVRDQHFSLVPDLFTDCFNLLIGWLAGGPQTVNLWREEAQEFIDLLQQPNDRASSDASLKLLKERVKKLKELKSLRRLDLDSNEVTDAGLKELKEFTELQTLILTSTGVTDAGLKELKELKSLVELKIYGAQITNAGLEVLKDIQSLNWLVLSNTKVTPKGFQRLKAALPGLHVLGG